MDLPVTAIRLHSLDTPPLATFARSATGATETASDPVMGQTVVAIAKL